MTYTANIIPAMTSATAPFGVASSSGNSSSYVEWRAFDHTNSVGGGAAWVAPSATGWLQYQFPIAHLIRRYAVTSRNSTTYVLPPKTWTFQGSNDGLTWDTLDTQTNITDWATSPNVRKVFDIANTTAYAYYRIDVTASNGTTVGVGELEMMEKVRFYRRMWNGHSVCYRFR